MQTLAGNEFYTQLGSLMEFPWEDVRPRVKVLSELAGKAGYPVETLEYLKAFQKGIEEMPLDNLQGIYSYTFEMSTDFTLDLGFHLHEGFKRTENLLQLKTMYRHFEFPFEELGKGELTDHLPLVLKFLGFLQDKEAQRDLMESFLIKALEKLRKNFDKNQDNPYKPLINFVYRVIDGDIKKDIKEEVK